MRPMHTFMQARKKIAKTTTVPASPKCMEAERGENGGAVGGVGHHGAELHTGKGQTAVDDGHEHAGDHTGARNLKGHALVIGNTNSWMVSAMMMPKASDASRFMH